MTQLCDLGSQVGRSQVGSMVQGLGKLATDTPEVARWRMPLRIQGSRYLSCIYSGIKSSFGVGHKCIAQRYLALWVPDFALEPSSFLNTSSNSSVCLNPKNQLKPNLNPVLWIVGCMLQ